MRRGDIPASGCLPRRWAALAGGGTARRRSAQEWWENFPGFKGQEGPRPAVNDERRRQDQVSTTCAPTRLPLRSQEMIEALEAAIQRYQQIVSNGGWPAITGHAHDSARGQRRARGAAAPPAVDERRAQAQAHQELFGIDYSEDLEGAVRRFQESNGLRVTGRADRADAAGAQHPGARAPAQLKINQQRLRDLIGHRGGGSLRSGQRRRLPARSRRQARGRAAPSRHRRQARAADADRARHHPRAQLLPVLAGARERGDARPHSAPGQGARVPAAGAHPRADGVLQRHRDRLAQRSTGGRRTLARLSFRQDPGPQNALGLVRIDMPNERASTCTTRR